MFKIQCPNTLFINAAHREDQVNFALDGINVNEYQYNSDGSVMVDDSTGSPVKITEERYAFSVSGSNTTRFALQMAHTNNNHFTYKIYPATQTTEEPVSGTYVEYTVTNEHNRRTFFASVSS